MSNFRCLSIRQPWAWAICAGLKRIENRTWSNAYRGPVAIHASAARETIKHLRKSNPDASFDWSQLAFGAIVGVADLVDVAELSPELEADEDAAGKVCWVFENGRLFAEPIPCKGKLTLHHLDEELSARIEKALDGPTMPVADEVADQYQQATRSQGNDIFYWRAVAYSELGDLENALRNCDRAIETGPPESFLHRFRGACLVDTGRAEECIDACNAALEIDSDDSRAYWLRAIAMEDLGRTAAADADRKRALELEPDLERNIGVEPTN